MRTLKNILNTIFIFGAIIGMYLYYKEIGRASCRERV